MKYGQIRLPHLVPLVAIFAVVACVSTPAEPDESLARAAALIEQAEQSGAREYASAELESARERLALAHAATDDKDHVLARQYAEEAELDARLASAKIRSAKAENAADEITDGLEILRQEVARHQAEQGD